MTMTKAPYTPGARGALAALRRAAATQISWAPAAGRLRIGGAQSGGQVKLIGRARAWSAFSWPAGYESARRARRDDRPGGAAQVRALGKHRTPAGSARVSRGQYHISIGLDVQLPWTIYSDLLLRDVFWPWGRAGRPPHRRLNSNRRARAATPTWAPNWLRLAGRRPGAGCRAPGAGRSASH